MDQPAEVCETYQLKWNYYNSYMHSCISTSLYNDSFADVALVTTDGHQVMAHRYILSYSSRYFAQILKYQRKVTTALPLMIVMPPEIDYKALKVLLRYMYSGEAKVPKEILKSVLHGGDVLQIKGLYREKDENDKSLKLVQTNQSFQSPFNSTPTNTPATTPTPLVSSPPPLVSTVITDPKVLKKIITPATSTTTAPLTQKTSTISTSTASSAAPTSSGQNSSAKNEKKVLPKFLIVQKPKEHQLITNTKNKAKVLNFTLLSNSEQNTLKKTCETESQIDEVVVKTEPVIRESNLQYLMIKDEPVDWSEADMEVIDSQEVYEDIQCKSEHENSSFDEEEKMFSPLTCELCTETFTVPKEWVRHVQTHTDMLPAKRRRRDSTGGSDSYENDTFPELMCDLCQKAFSTPAEWVKHIQSAHTEFELHLSNKRITSDSSKSPKFRNTSQNSHSSDQGKLCTDCNKTFPSNASMLIHKRSHTGEKPFSCEWCPKTFNVKSNLLRHLRTIHDKIINATELDNKEEGKCVNVESY